MFLSVDDGRSRISVIAFQGVCYRRFLALMVGALRPPTSLPKGSTVDVS
jgi:hypothetical protein